MSAENDSGFQIVCYWFDLINLKFDLIWLIFTDFFKVFLGPQRNVTVLTNDYGKICCSINFDPKLNYSWLNIFVMFPDPMSNVIESGNSETNSNQCMADITIHDI